MYQILKAIRYAHLNCIMHRDLKPQNVLVEMRSGRVKVADFGLARSFLPPCKAYTDKVVTLWYRAPELLLGARTYSALIDMWSMGCIMAELLNSEPLFRAESEIGLLHKVFQALGTPSEDCWAGVAQLQHFRASFPQWIARPWQQVGRAEGGREGTKFGRVMRYWCPLVRSRLLVAMLISSKLPWAHLMMASMVGSMVDFCS